MNKPSTESDYIKAKFRVSSAYELIPGDNIYLFGELTNWKVSEKYKLTKNNSSGLYELELKIKQGYYNYEYIVTNDLKGPFSSGEFEGNHVETENDYTIFVYEYHQLFDTYTLVGISRLHSQILNSR